VAYSLVYTSVTSDVAPLIAGRTISASTKPTTTQVEEWLAQAEIAMVGALGGAGVSVPASTADGAHILRAWIAEFAVGNVKLTWLDSDQIEEGRELVKRFWDRFDQIRENASFFDAMLNGGSSGEGSRMTRGYVLDNADDKSITDGDFDPIFDEDWEA